MPEFTKVWSVANIALNKLTARLFTDEVLQSSCFIQKIRRNFEIYKIFIKLHANGAFLTGNANLIIA